MSTDTSPRPTLQLDPWRAAGAPSIRPSGRHAVALAIATLVLLPLVSACGITSQTEPSSPPSHGHVTGGDGGAVTHPRADENEADEDDNESTEANENERDETDNESDENERDD